MFKRKSSEDIEQSLTISTINDDNDIIYSSESQLNNNYRSISNSFELINSPKIVNESSQATIRILPSSVSRYLLSNNHLSEIDSSEIIIIQNLGVQNNHQVFTNESFFLFLMIIFCFGFSVFIVNMVEINYRLFFMNKKLMSINREKN